MIREVKISARDLSTTRFLELGSLPGLKELLIFDDIYPNPRNPRAFNHNLTQRDSVATNVFNTVVDRRGYRIDLNRHIRDHQIRCVFGLRIPRASGHMYYAVQLGSDGTNITMSKIGHMYESDFFGGAKKATA